jgi:type VI secretion system secreted protein Hcp
MAVADMYLKLDGVDGEAKDTDHTNEIEIMSFSFGVSNQGSGAIGVGSGASKARVNDVTVMKYVDKASPGLFQNCCIGKSFKSATLTVRKAGGDKPVNYLVYNMDEVFITNVSTSGSDGGGIATESVSLNFAKITVTYTEQNADGSAGKDTPKWYSVKEHNFG